MPAGRTRTSRQLCGLPPDETVSDTNPVPPRLTAPRRSGGGESPNRRQLVKPRTPSVDEIRSWPVTIDVKTAGRAFGIGRDQAYRLSRQDEFPVPVLRLGRYLRVTRASVLEALGIDSEARPAA